MGVYNNNIPDDIKGCLYEVDKATSKLIKELCRTRGLEVKWQQATVVEIKNHNNGEFIITVSSESKVKEFCDTDNFNKRKLLLL